MSIQVENMRTVGTVLWEAGFCFAKVINHLGKAYKIQGDVIWLYLSP